MAIRTIIFAVLLAALSFPAILPFASPAAFAHGGVPIEDDKCKLKVGPYNFHFVGYQPVRMGTQELCQKIPKAGFTIFVLDFLEPELRTKKVQLALFKDNEKIADTPGTIYSTGSFKLEQNLSGEGNYMAEVTVKDPASGNQYVGHFPIKVGGFSIGTAHLMIGLLIAGLIGGMAIYHLGASRAAKVGAPISGGGA